MQRNTFKAITQKQVDLDVIKKMLEEESLRIETQFQEVIKKYLPTFFDIDDEDFSLAYDRRDGYQEGAFYEMVAAVRDLTAKVVSLQEKHYLSLNRI